MFSSAKLKSLKNMQNKLIRIWIHTFFSVKDYMPLIKESFEDQLTKRIRKKLESEYKSKVKNIKAIENHIHILFMLNPNFNFTDILKNIKGESSHWINQNNFLESKFSWQKSYSALSVSESQLEKVNRYINNQMNFHKQFTFLQEVEMFSKNIFENPESKPFKTVLTPTKIKTKR